MIRRARPILGTIVAISAEAPPSAVETAFAAIERVHQLMSAQRAESDIGRINREALGRPVPVHAWTYEVLKHAMQISERSGGAFDIVTPESGARYTDVVLDQGCVRLLRPARIDVSGVAKGYAVDRGVEILRAKGAWAGSINAGGDLRFFGDWQDPVRVRMPGNLAAAICLPRSSHKAFATSSGYFGANINDLRTGACSRIDWSVTVAAATCLVADALTKVVALLGPARSLLKQFDAVAFAIDSGGQLHAAAG